MAVLDHSIKGDKKQSSRKRKADETESGVDISISKSRTRKWKMLKVYIIMPDGQTMLDVSIRSNFPILALLVYVEKAAGIPAIKHYLDYQGRPLEMGQTLEDCEEDVVYLRLVERNWIAMHEGAWYGLVETIGWVGLLSCGDEITDTDNMLMIVWDRVNQYLANIPKACDFCDSVEKYLEVFLETTAHKALVMLYMTHDGRHKDCVTRCIKSLVHKVLGSEDFKTRVYGTRIVLELCRLLVGAANDPLYRFCRSALSWIVLQIGVIELLETNTFCYHVSLTEILPFFHQVARKLGQDLVLSLEPTSEVGPHALDVADFAAFCHPIRCLLSNVAPIKKSGMQDFGNEPKLFYGAYVHLMNRVYKCLEKLEGDFSTNGDISGPGWCHLLDILGVLKSISEIYEDEEVLFRAKMTSHRIALQAVILKYSIRDRDYRWLVNLKDALNFASRRHLALLLLPITEQEYGVNQINIDRSDLLRQSFQYISGAYANELRRGLNVKFRYEVAFGPGVTRVWFYHVFQELFNPLNALFDICPHDRWRIFPNSACDVQPMQLQYFHFAGRMLALALMRNIRVGFVLDRSFHTQLAGNDISLEDIRDCDPYMYNSCRQILAMEPEIFDSIDMALSFVWETGELGSKKMVELCEGGDSIMVHSSNRIEYVKLLVEYRFVKSVSGQISNFAEGFSDIIGNAEKKNMFFSILEPDDLDSILYGCSSDICVEDWKKHTMYRGYEESDDQILWFWQIVAKMPEERKRCLLFFWTSIRYLPLEGFCGLESRLLINGSSVPEHFLPSSNTCTYTLSFPPYRSMRSMLEHLNVITQDSVACSFGNY